jgi:hypothetical protein
MNKNDLIKKDLSIFINKFYNIDLKTNIFSDIITVLRFCFVNNEKSTLKLESKYLILRELESFFKEKKTKINYYNLSVDFNIKKNSKNSYLTLEVFDREDNNFFKIIDEETNTKMSYFNKEYIKHSDLEKNKDNLISDKLILSILVEQKDLDVLKNIKSFFLKKKLENFDTSDVDQLENYFLNVNEYLFSTKSLLELTNRISNIVFKTFLNKSILENTFFQKGYDLNSLFKLESNFNIKLLNEFDIFYSKQSNKLLTQNANSTFYDLNEEKKNKNFLINCICNFDISFNIKIFKFKSTLVIIDKASSLNNLLFIIDFHNKLIKNLKFDYKFELTSISYQDKNMKINRFNNKNEQIFNFIFNKENCKLIFTAKKSKKTHFRSESAIE